MKDWQKCMDILYCLYLDGEIFFRVTSLKISKVHLQIETKISLEKDTFFGDQHQMRLPDINFPSFPFSSETLRRDTRIFFPKEDAFLCYYHETYYTRIFQVEVKYAFRN